MLSLIPFLSFLSFVIDTTTSSRVFYYYKDSHVTEVIRINTNRSYECYRESTLRHSFPFYCQGYYDNDDTSYILRPGIVDSLTLSVNEQSKPAEANKWFSRTNVKIISEEKNFWQLIYFNYDHLNRIQYDKEIKLCVEQVNGTMHYKRLDTKSMEFGEIVSEGKPYALYIMVGAYRVTKKYYVQNTQSNYFEISINKNDLFTSFKDFYLANHKLKKRGNQLVDLATGRIYTALDTKNTPHSIEEVVNSQRF